MSGRDAELQRMLELYRDGQAPSPGARDRVWQDVEQEIATPAGPAGSSSGGGAGGSSAGLGKSLWMSGVFVLGAFGTWLALDANGPEHPRPESREAVAARPATTPAPPSPAALVEPLPQAPTAQTPPAAQAPLAAESVVSERHTLPPLAAGSPPMPVAQPRVRPVSSSLAAEMKLLAAAQRAAHNGQHRKALSLLRAHRHRFPAGAMAEEREAERVVSLCALERVSEGRAVARSFLARFPGSPLSSQVERACGGPT